MRRIGCRLLILCLILMKAHVLDAQVPNSQNELKINLPPAFEWKTESFGDEDMWGKKYLAFEKDSQHPVLEFQQVNHHVAYLGRNADQMATQIRDFIQAFAGDTRLVLERQEEIAGDKCSFYTLRTARPRDKGTVMILFFRERDEDMHYIEMELHDDVAEVVPLDEWQRVFFASQVTHSEER